MQLNESVVNLSTDTTYPYTFNVEMFFHVETLQLYADVALAGYTRHVAAELVSAP